MDETREVLELAVRLALAAGEIQLERYETRLDISTKGESIDLVTEVDRQCEALIVEELARARADDAVLAEEGGGRDFEGAEWRWIIDPLDGTTNYAHGFPRFCVSIGVERRDERTVGVVYDPLLDELFHATRGGGAFLQKTRDPGSESGRLRFERRLAVSTERKIGEALVATGFAYDVHKSQEDNLANFARMIKATRAVRRDGSAALDLCYVAAGRFDAFWEFKLHAWDVAAGLLMVEEAGGRCTNLAGGPPARSGVEAIVSNGHLHDQVLKLLRQAG